MVAAARCALLASFVLAPHAGMSAEPAGMNIALHGTSTAPACVSCHGAFGQGMSAAAVPRLAGQHATYLAEQLANLRDGSRSNVVMTPIATALSQQESAAVANYYANLLKPARTSGATNPPDTPSALAAGKSIAAKGMWSRQVPACNDCHGVNGLGVGAAFPVLAAQPASYLAEQLHAFKQKTRNNGPLGLMQGVAMRLSDSDISQVADYYASLPSEFDQKATP